jgi:hypothetical protein
MVFPAHPGVRARSFASSPDGNEAARFLADEQPVLGGVFLGRFLPSVQRLAVEETDETLARLFLRQLRRRDRQLGFFRPVEVRTQEAADHRETDPTHETVLPRYNASRHRYNVSSHESFNFAP